MNLVEMSIIGPAFVAGLLVIATHVPLGAHVLRRGIIFIDLAIAQVAGLGVITADWLGFEPSGIAVQVSAISAALIAAIVLHQTDRRWPQIQEALIGVCFVLAATAGILVLAENPHGGENLKELLVGQILWVTYDQLIPVAALTVVLLGLWFGLRDRISGFAFYVLFAFAVTASVQLVGIYLVFASLIVPAIATRKIEQRTRRLLSGYGVGLGGYALGLITSAWLDLPSGAVIVWALVAVAFVFSLTQRWFRAGATTNA